MTHDLLAHLLDGVPWAILEGDAETVELPPASFDALITDPPAGISFMGRAWDDDKGGEAEWIAWLARVLRRAFDALKPGAHALVWALPRTSDWTMQAIRRAGFEVRDVVTHVFATGFPKSLDVSKAIGDTPEAARWRGWGTALKPASEHWILARKPLNGTVAANVLRHGTGGLNVNVCRVGTSKEVPSSPSAAPRTVYRPGQPQASASALDPLVGRWPANLVLSHAAWEETRCPCGASMSFVARFCPECGSGEVEHHRGGCCATVEREVEANGSIPPGGAAAGSRRNTVLGEDRRPRGPWAPHGNGDGTETIDAWACLASCACGLSMLAPSGSVPPCCRCGRAMVWACPVARLDEQSGTGGMHSAGAARTPQARMDRSAGHVYGTGIGGGSFRYGDTERGSAASRFFHCLSPADDVEPFFFVAKPPAAETEAGCEHLPLHAAAECVDREEGSAGTRSPRAGAGRTSGRRNHHPTKKPLDLMRLFVRLVTPPGGAVLDLFAGSGTTIAAAALEGCRGVGVERAPEYVPIARARCAFWARLSGTRAVAVAKKTPRPKRTKAGRGQGDLFGGTGSS